MAKPPRPTAEWLWYSPAGTTEKARWDEANAAIRAYFKMGSSFPDSQITEISLFHGSVVRIRAFGKKAVANRLHRTVDKRWSELKSQHDYDVPPAAPETEDVATVTVGIPDGPVIATAEGSVRVNFAPSDEPETTAGGVVVVPEPAQGPTEPPEPPQEPAEPLPPLPDPLPDKFISLKHLATARGVDIADIKGAGTVKRIQDRLKEQGDG